MTLQKLLDGLQAAVTTHSTLTLVLVYLLLNLVEIAPIKVQPLSPLSGSSNSQWESFWLVCKLLWALLSQRLGDRAPSIGNLPTIATLLRSTF